MTDWLKNNLYRIALFGARIYLFVKNIEAEIVPKVQIEICNTGYFGINELPENTTKRTKFRINEYQKGLPNISKILMSQLLAWQKILKITMRSLWSTCTQSMDTSKCGFAQWRCF